MATREAARQAVARISEKFGHLDEHELDRLEQFDPELRRKVERSLLAKDKIAGHAIITHAHNLYGCDARFVFELLQHADNNCYTRARARKDPPSVSFNVYSDRIVVECNEDSFTEQDLQAICSVGQSSKPASHGYISAKDIGFKSVFIAAWKVHIQSGYFSFYLKHKKGESGLGMVTPIWQDSEEALVNPLTRMTLYLHDIEAEAHLTHLREIILEQLSDLQEECLLFLRNLESINIKFYDEREVLTASKRLSRRNIDSHRVELWTGESYLRYLWESKIYHVTRHEVANLSRSVARDIPDSDTARNAASRAEVVLAFQLTKDEEALPRNQDLFAFLPLQKSGFKVILLIRTSLDSVAHIDIHACQFIIQSDFDTTANRRDIITTSLRNIDLVDAIADTFIKAALQFCEHPKLCYTWPKFLPSSENRITAFWSRLRDKIEYRMSATPLLLPRHGKTLQKIDSVFQLASDFKDDARDPLLDDPANNVFLSNKYHPAAKKILRQYGLQNTDVSVICDLLCADLARENSRMKSSLTTQGWHSTMAKLLRRFPSRFRSLALLPLRSGAWVAPDIGPVHLPTTSSISVPPGIDLRVLDRTAVANDDRKAMFMEYGATEPTVTTVRSSILRAYDIPRNVDVAQSRAHLHFLYLSHAFQPMPVRENYHKIYLFTSSGDVKVPCEEDIFLPTDHPYGAQQLLGPVAGVPGLPVSYIHPQYLLEPPEPPSAQHPTWTHWLHDFIGLRKDLRLIARSGDKLSDAWTYVATHKPDKLLGMLEHLWRHEGSRIKENNMLKSQIQNTEVKDLCVSPLGTSCTLEQSFLPLTPLKKICETYIEQAEPFPFLKLDHELTSEQLRTKWIFLHEDLSVGLEAGVTFLTQIIFWLKRAYESEPKFAHHKKFVELYIALHAKILESAHREDEKQQIEKIFDRNEYLFVPLLEDVAGEWASALECLWDGPSDSYTKFSLKAIYSRSFGSDRADQVSQFFRSTLKIPDATIQDVLAELQYRKAEDLHEFDRIVMLYEWISAEANANPQVRRLVKHYFDEEEMIYVFKDEIAAWYKTNDCIWSSTTDIRGKVTLNEDYEHLEDFFINVLSVKKLTLQMVFDDILQTDARTLVAEAKGAIWSLNAVLQTTTDIVDPAPMLSKNIFPVSYPNGTTILTSALVDFSIGDRKYLIAHFKNKIKMLDFDLAEIRQLTSFLSWTRLGDRCLSRSVKEITFVHPDDARPILVPARDLKLRAHAILRIAASFASPGYLADGPALYRSLQTMKTLVTSRISSVLRLVQNGVSTDVKIEAGDMHMAELNGIITIYVPRDKRKQDFCFASPLPAKLADWLMRDGVTKTTNPKSVDEAMVITLTTLLNVAPAMTNLVLDRQGVAKVPEANEDLESYDDTQEKEEEKEATFHSAKEHDEHGIVSVRQTASIHNDLRMVEERLLEIATRVSRADHERFGGASLPRLVPARNESTNNVNQHCDILGKVVSAAHRARVLSGEAFDMSALHTSLLNNTLQVTTD